MGKGNRERLKKAQAQVDNASVFTKKEKKHTPAWVGTLVIILVVVLLVACVALSVVSEGGYLLRWTNVVKSNNYAITGTMMSYYFYGYYNSFVSQYGSYLSYLGLETGTSLKTQAYGEDGQTWFDYFMDAAVSEGEKLLVYCEEANARGIKLDDEDYKIIDSAIDALKTAAASYNYSPEAYCTAMYGTGVKLKDVRRAMEYTQLASKCSTIVSDEVTDAVTDADINTYYDTNKNTFLSADILSYSTKVSSTSTTEGYDYDAEKAKADKLSEALKDCKTADSFKKYVAEYEADAGFDALYDKQAAEYDSSVLPDADTYTKRRAEVVAKAAENALAGKTETATDSTETIEKIFSNVLVSLTDSVTAKVDALENSKYTYSDADDAGKWVSDSARAAGDTTVITATADDSYTTTAYLIIEPMHRDEELTRNIGHILFKPDTYETEAKAQAKAEEVLAKFTAGEQTKEAFEALGNEYTEDSSVFYEDVANGDMVAAFNDWMFDSSRKVGDTGIVETSYGFHVMYYLGESSPAWYVSVKNAIVSENVEKWYDEKVTAFGVKTDTAAATKVSA